MAINVTPIPKLTAMAAPAFTLGTANAAGDALTAVSSNSTLLAFDATAPAAVAAAAVVGTATVSARRDHVHPGTTGAGTVVDDAITRFNGTGGSSLQGYSSLAPTISDAGIISLTSGALKFPATAINDGDANTLDEYQEGSWTPVLWDSGLANKANGYTATVGRYTKIGQVVYISFKIESTNITGLTASDPASIGGLPYVPTNTASMRYTSAIGASEQMSLGTAGFTVTAYCQGNESYLKLNLNDVTTGQSRLLISEWGANGFMSMSGFYFSA